jgi:NAD+ kinase
MSPTPARNRPIGRVALVVKNSAAAANAAADLENHLRQKGLDVVVDEPQVDETCPPDRSRVHPLPSEVDLVVVLGGDGTLLYAARTFGRQGIPLLGVNLGGLGFLTETSLENLYPMLEKVLAGDFVTESRMMLAAEVHRNGRPVTHHHVLNDVVINKGALARILTFSVKVDDTNLTWYRADGLILSTPTGSTAYNLAAGGPIVYPTHESIALTPICPFTLSNRPLILPQTAVIEIGLEPGATDALLTSDGQVSCPLLPEDRVVIRRAEHSIVLIKNPYKNYFDILRTKLGWG